eukprot:5703486-Amphidinium_carterae.1
MPRESHNRIPPLAHMPRPEGGIPGENENRRQEANPSGTHAEGEAVRPPPDLDHYIRPTAK